MTTPVPRAVRVAAWRRRFALNRWRRGRRRALTARWLRSTTRRLVEALTDDRERVWRERPDYARDA